MAAADPVGYDGPMIDRVVLGVLLATGLGCSSGATPAPTTTAGSAVAPGPSPTIADAPAPGPAAAASSPVQQLVTSPELAPYWHADQPGRVPVRLVVNPASSDRPVFAMFGQPVVWIERAAATAGTAFVEVQFVLVDGLLELSLHYPIEGVVARATFVPVGDGWRREGAIRVVER